MLSTRGYMCTLLVVAAVMQTEAKLGCTKVKQGRKSVCLDEFGDAVPWGLYERICQFNMQANRGMFDKNNYNQVRTKMDQAGLGSSDCNHEFNTNVGVHVGHIVADPCKKCLEKKGSFRQAWLRFKEKLTIFKLD